MIEITCRALLFDLDGVLADSTAVVARVWTEWALEHGFDPVEVVRQAHGRPSLATVRDYLPDADHELENLRVEGREIADVQGVVALPGAQELLASLPRDRWTIVTSCTRPLAEVRIRAAGLPLPENLVTADDIIHGKPNPEPYMKGAKQLGFAAQDCVVFEDVPAGVRSGKAAGARVVAFRTTVSDTELRNAGADWVVDGCGVVSVMVGGNNQMLRLTLSVEQSTAGRQRK
ncbi:MAG: HAD family hydrolase [Terriglobales bacterium]